MDVLDTEGALAPADTANAPDGAVATAERDYEAEARSHGWQPPGEFKGDQSKCVDAKTFVERADTFLPFIKKARDDARRETDELKRTIKQYVKHADKVEERAYQRALADLESRHADAVETGDVAAAKAVVREIGELEKPAPEPKPDDREAAKKFGAWVENSEFYGVDDAKTKFADIQAVAMGPAMEWDGGPDAYLAEIERRVNRKFAEKKPSITNGGGNRSAPGDGGKSFTDLPPEAKAMCDKFIRTGLFKDRAEYVASYQFD